MGEDSMLDLLGLVLLIGIAIVVMIGTMTNLVSESKESLYETINDKTVSQAQGEVFVTNSNYAGDLSKLEAVLATQVYDWGSPNPRLLIVDGTQIEITSVYKHEMEAYAQQMWNEIGTDDDSSRYRYRYDFNNYRPNYDGAYVLEKVN